MNRGYQQYKEQSINTMTPNELMLMLFDELVKRITRAELALDKEDFDLFEESTDRCVAIIRYLDDTLDRQYSVSNDLHRMYDFFSYTLNRIKYGRNKEELLNIKPMLIELRDTFRTAEKASNAAAEVPTPTPAQTGGQP